MGGNNLEGHCILSWAKHIILLMDQKLCILPSAIRGTRSLSGLQEGCGFYSLIALPMEPSDYPVHIYFSLQQPDRYYDPYSYQRAVNRRRFSYFLLYSCPGR